MTRRRIREVIFQIIFGIEYYSPEEIDAQIDLSFEEVDDLTEEGGEYIRARVKEVAEKTEEIDAQINEVATKWKTSRMGKTELSILRLAVYEMKYDDSIDVAVSINEAVELAKIYGGDDSPKFVNGILAKLA